MKHTLRAVLAVALLVGFYVVALGIAVGVVALVIEAGVLGVSAGVLAKFFVLAVLAALAIVRGLFLRSRSNQQGPGGIPVTAEQQPQLWAEVRALAAAVGTRAPDEVRLVPAVNAAVAEDSRLIGLVPGTRRLYVGVPLLLGLTRGQVRSVLAHELGHYSGKHTALGPVTYRGKEAIARVLNELGPNSLLGALLLQYGKLYYAVAHSISRRQELEADGFSAQLVSPTTAASALREVPALSAAWEHFTAAYVPLGVKYHQRPADLFVGFSALLADPATQEQLARLRAELPEPDPSIYDSHPPLAQRIAALEALPVDATVRSDVAPGLDLLVDQRATLARFEDEIFEGSGRDSVRWEFLVARAGAQQVAGAPGVLAENAEKLGLAPVTMAGVVAKLAQPGRPGLSEEVAEEQEREFLGNLLGDVAADALVQRGVATFKPAWSGNVGRLTTVDGVELDPWTPAQETAGSHDVRPFRDWALAHGIDLDVVLEPPVRATPPDDPVTPDNDWIIGVMAPVRYRRRTRALVVTRAGILIAHVSLGRALAFGCQAQYGKGGVKLARKFAKDSIARLRRHPKALSLPWSEITSLTVTDRRLRSSLINLTMANGAEAVLKCDGWAADVGEPWVGIREYLGSRVAIG